MALASGLPAEAAARMPAPIVLNEAQQQELQRLNDYINSFQSLRGEFVQTNDKGQSVKGLIFLSKPGKIRFDYAPPSPLVIVSDGKWLLIKNKVRNRGDQVPLKSTPLRLIVSPQVNLLQETHVLSVDEADGIASIALADKKNSLDGYIVLIFDTQQNQLQQWIVVDGKGRRTTVQLSNLETDVKLDPKLFVEKVNQGNQ
ncbi:MAG: outer membrane lipoprotein carrier protein LolA [Hyphomicrobiales bacterium]